MRKKAPLGAGLSSLPLTALIVLLAGLLAGLAVLLVALLSALTGLLVRLLVLLAGGSAGRGFAVHRPAVVRHAVHDRLVDFPLVFPPRGMSPRV